MIQDSYIRSLLINITEQPLRSKKIVINNVLLTKKRMLLEIAQEKIINIGAITSFQILIRPLKFLIV